MNTADTREKTYAEKLLARSCTVLALIGAGILHAADFTVSTPTTMTAEQSAIYYDNVYVNADLTIDGADRGLTNGTAAVIGANAAAPVTIVVTNGAKWVVNERKTVTMSGKGGTFVVSAPTEPVFSGGSAQSMVIGNVNPNHLGTVGYYTDVVIDGTVKATGGVLDIARLLTNGTVSFRQVKNTNPGVAARLLFEGGVHWLANESSTIKNRFRTENGSRIVLESVDGNPICLRSSAQSYTLFTGTGTLETAGAGDFIMQHANNSAENTGVIKLSVDEGGEIVWGHGGCTVMKGVGIWRVLTDDVLPFGPQTGPVVISPGWANPGVLSATLDLNGKTSTVNGLLCENVGKANYTAIVTNSSETVAALRLNVATNAVMSGLLTANFAANAAANVRLQKTGAGTLTIDKMPAVAGFDVLEGAVVGTVNASVGDITAKNGATLMVKAPSYDGFNSNQGFLPGILAVDAGDGAAVLSNVWQNALVVRSGTARIENGAERIPPAERAGHPVRSQIGAVSVDGGVLDIVRGRLSSTNVAVAAGAALHIGGGASTNRVEFYAPELTDRYYRFVFKAVNGGAFGLNYLFLRTKDGSDEFSAKSAGGVNQYTLDESAATAADLAPGEYMFSCPNGLVFTTGNGGNQWCTYAKDGLTSLNAWGGVRINDGTTPSLANPNTWVTLTIRLRNEAALPVVGYTLRQAMGEKRLAAWEVLASADGMTWRTVDERTAADIYEYSHGSNPNYYGWFNNGEPFEWRCPAAGNAFNCAGFVQVDEGGVLDLNCVPDANISIKGLTVDASVGGGAITKFRPAADGVLNIIGLVGDPPVKYTASVTLAEVVDAAHFNSWRVTLDGTAVRGSSVKFDNGVLTAHLASGLIIVVR